MKKSTVLFFTVLSLCKNAQPSDKEPPMILQNPIKANECCQSDQQKTEKHLTPKPALDPSLLKEISTILSTHFNQEVRLISFMQLSEDKRRNLIIRIGVESSTGNVPKTLIFKQTLQRDSSEKKSDSLRRFARDWAGLAFLNEQEFPLIPHFYGGSLAYRFVLLEDLGEEHVSLVDALISNDPQTAETALYRFVKCLGQFHAAGYSNTQDYFNIIHNLYSTTEDWHADLQRSLDKFLPKLRSTLKILAIPESESLGQEIKEVFKANIEPGPFTTLIHGDICPDNVFDNPLKNEMHLIDFEHAAVRSALLDGTYLRMSMPTCWCAKAFPSKLIPLLENAYRNELIKKIPAAKDDVAYYTAYVNACAFWVLKSILFIEDVLEKDVVGKTGPTPPNSFWKPEKNLVRPRIISRLRAFIEVSRQYGQLPSLRKMAEQILTELKARWVDAQPLEVYPAFSRTPN